MKKGTMPMVLALSLVLVLAAPVSAQAIVGGALMYANKDVIGNALNSKEHTTPVAAVKAAGLVDTLKGQAHSPCSPDAKGDMAHVTTLDVTQGNGVIHGVDRVLLPG